MKKNILFLVGVASCSACLCSCGDKSTFKIETVDPVISYSYRDLGFKIRFTADSKFVENPKYEDIKLSCEPEGKMTFELDDFSSSDPYRAAWIARAKEAGTFKVTLAINGIKSNELALTVNEPQYASEDFVLPDNIKIDIKYSLDEEPSSIYKIGKSAVTTRFGNEPAIYIPEVGKALGYGNPTKYKFPEVHWEEFKRVTDPYSVLKLQETHEYTSKNSTSITISGKEYNATEYNFNGVKYTYIKSETLSLVAKMEGHYRGDFEVVGLDTSITAFPEDFQLPK